MLVLLYIYIIYLHIHTYIYNISTHTHTHTYIYIYGTNIPPIMIINRIYLFLSWRYNLLWVCILQPSSGAIASSLTRFLGHIQRRATAGRTPLYE